jgi:hypothetical protein
LRHGLFHEGVLGIGWFGKDEVIIINIVVVKEASVGVGAGKDGRDVWVAVVVIVAVRFG